ncbi:hypothetical protein F9L16_23890 [Agarivorans sp. B2Z047]|uniref:hypothetical protein n=1 Tax=Agarivorans sp. B2Z047 TaxID=2652721 RepID=UPI00128B94CC|nr:hypothetical protein [Agarivorans sp. B2Z047]MPW31992.1 hypothetical protein [Agarivorans sp. B2Z047]UQN41864.1 hypothetical protein LQZ07_19110 [Agarivorans sp. B2Z047]
MSFSFLLNQTTNDYSIKGGRLVISNGSDAAVDRVYVRLQTEFGEWFLDITKGVPYYGEGGILGGKLGTGEVSAILRREILDVIEVDKINLMSVTKDRRALTINSDISIQGQSEPIRLSI